MLNFEEELTELINKCCEENKSNTPDFILALFMLACLKAFNRGICDRDTWYKINPEPGKVDLEND